MAREEEREREREREVEGALNLMIFQAASQGYLQIHAIRLKERIRIYFSMRLENNYIFKINISANYGSLLSR